VGRRSWCDLTGGQIPLSKREKPSAFFRERLRSQNASDSRRNFLLASEGHGPVSDGSLRSAPMPRCVLFCRNDRGKRVSA
jgi:hypothetical protein